MLQIVQPYDGALIKTIPMQSLADVEQCLDKAYKVFNEREKWLPAYQRITILERVITIMSDKRDSLAKLAASEGGKPLLDSNVEVDRAINGVKLAIESIAQLAGDEIPMGHTVSSANRLAFTRREPIGVVVAVSAFNHPLNLIIHQVIPAIAVGAPVIIKPAKATPLSCLAFIDILREAGLPDEWCQVVICSHEVTEKLVTDKRVNFFSFIGSGDIGWALRAKLSAGTRCALEHGGVAPVIIDKSRSANLDMANPQANELVSSLVKGAFYHAGQVCVSVQRIYVPLDDSKALAMILANAAKELVVGDPLDPATEVGPLISPSEVDRVETWVEEAREAGAMVLCGGQRLSDTCYAPTVLLNPPEDLAVSTNEIFGPVVCVYSYSEKNDAIRRANRLPFAFQAAIYSNDLDDVIATSAKLNASTVMVNDHTAFRVDWMPFGGRDESGLGMGGILHSMKDMTREKMVVIKSPSL